MMKLLLRRVLTVVCGMAVLACMMACGQIQQAAQEGIDGAKVGLALKAYADKNKDKTPPDAGSFAKWCTENGQADAVPVINGGNWTFYWNVDLAKLPDGKTNTVIAYSNKAAQGPAGAVVYGDGRAEVVDPDRFKGMKKAGGK
jgi:hypothetical protein